VTGSRPKRPRDRVAIASWIVVCALVPVVAASMAARDPESTKVVVPRVNIPRYHTLESRDLRIADRSGNSLPGAATSVAAVAGTIATRELRAGRPIPQRVLIRRPPELSVSPVAVDLRDPTVIGGPVRTGDRVLVARRASGGGRQVVAPLAVVLDAAAPGRLTLAVSPEQWAKLVDDPARWLVVRRL
jgi:hypothetical protein